jgi:uncharacterized membrane protein YebE (DUF533 family)
MTPATPQIPGQPISTSTFYMWRVIIAIAHADDMVDDEERAYLTKIFANMDRVYGLTDEQKKTFAADIDSPTMQSIPELMSHINDPSVRGQVIYFGGLLAHADGVVTAQEDAILKKLRADQMSSLDMDAIRAHVKEAVADEMFKHDMKQQALRPHGTLSAILDSMMLRLGIDMMED